MPRTTTPSRKLPRLLQGGLAASTSIELDRAQAHYLLDVMRKKLGDKVRLFNDRDGEWLASITDTGRRHCQVEITEQLRLPEKEPGPTLLFAPIKKSRLDLLVEKATELGVGRLMPVSTRRSIVDRVNVERLRLIVIEAAEQCERLTVPDIEGLQTLERALSDWPAEHRLYIADESGGGRPLLQVFERERPAAFLIGPEGGFEPEELAWLDEFPQVTRVDLGSRILRAETAAIMALACAEALRGSGRM